MNRIFFFFFFFYFALRFQKRKIRFSAGVTVQQKSDVSLVGSKFMADCVCVQGGPILLFDLCEGPAVPVCVCVRIVVVVAQ